MRLILDLLKSFFIFRSLVKKNKIEIIITNTSQTLLGGVVAKKYVKLNIFVMLEKVTVVNFMENFSEIFSSFFRLYSLCFEGYDDAIRQRISFEKNICCA